MNKTTRFCRLILSLFLYTAIAWRASATVFTTNTGIGPLNTNYDGQDIVISNCTVTVDGAHTFASLVVATNGILTHSFSANGQLTVAVNVTNAPYVLSGTTPDQLAGSNIFTPLLVTDGIGDIYSNGVDYVEFSQNYTNYIITEIELTTNSSIPNGGTVLVSYSYDANISAGLDLTVTGTVWVANGGEIDADDIGYGGGSGPGAGSNSGGTFSDGSGGGYGGSGGMSNSVGGVCYDSLYQPASPGSGGGASYAGGGGNGGGLVQITAGGNVEIDGIISAAGQSATNARAGGGSGGGIWISAASLSGSGSITANGGSGAPGYGGGGGGGRIAIVCGTDSFAGTIAAFGGAGMGYGGAGTVFTELMGLPGLLAMNNGGNIGAYSSVTLSNLADVAISNSAAVAVSGAFLPQNLTVGTNGILTGLSLTSLQFSASNLTVTAGGVVSVNGLGYNSGGSGAGGIYTSGNVTYGGGGGHGGIGGAAAVTNAYGGAAVFDAQADPTSFGGNGGGNTVTARGAGGGAINLSVSGALQVNGLISANGGNSTGAANVNPGGGGGGGSIYITAGTFSGAGAVTANGGNGAGALGGGGGGGRIAIFASTFTFSGAANCFGGGGANYGGSGTVFLSQNSGSQSLVLDNGGNTGPSTPLQSATGANLIVQNGAWGTLSSGSTFLNLVVASNAWVTTSPNENVSTVTVLSNAVFQVGGGLTANGEGSNLGGPGSGGNSSSTPYPGGGGGNGGAGGAGSVGPPFGGAGGISGFNTVSSPNDAGGNGGGYNPYSFGGNGGGGVKLIVDGTLQVNGVVSANGGNGYGEGGGGGAGGSLILSASTFTGSGSVLANGGNGVASVGGGGGGGCIAITFNTNGFNGTLAALGGIGANNGGAGTIYFKTNSATYGELVLDNGGLNGAPSTLSSLTSSTDLTLRNNSILYYGSSASLSVGNLLITNASIVESNSTLNITANNLTLQSGGRITATGAGYTQNSGPDAGRVFQSLPYPGSGGGNGGCGGMTISNEVIGGGAAYEPYTLATEAGSGGGGQSPYSTGGNGGGVLELTVFGTLAMNGTISADGGNGAGTGGGGGAGGSLDLVVGGLTGSGVMSANGGNGVGNIGGGGGGGMIAINFQYGTISNLFTGNISAYGGGGATNGGAGTIFIRTNSTSQATLIVDNGGNRGTNTPITITSSSYALVVRNGAIAAPPVSGSFSSLLVASNSWLVPQTSGQNGQINLNLSGNATIQAGGGIIVDSSGFAQGFGSGPGSSSGVYPTFPSGGGGHGGDGAFSVSNLVPGGITYDNVEQPTLNGSGGGGYSPYSTGGSGGGLVELALGSSALQLNGIISANGGNGSGAGGGGGSGGAINITAGTITGTGSIMANGGNGASNGGGGGGGCISLFSGLELRTNFFLGTISAYGGGGANYGGAGTIYYRTNNNPLGLTTPVLYLDNGNNVGTNTTLNVSGINVNVQNGAIGAVSLSAWSPDIVMVASNSELTSLVGQLTMHAQSLTISTGAVFSLDGVGYSAQNGSGAGAASGGISGGGGHGGYGGGNASGGGAAYDSIQAPTAEGSGGANSSANPGGAGGGALTLFATTFVNNGRISANGRAGGLNAGGGAGGSIYIEFVGLPAFSGSGIIAANGGAGSGTAGGGAGGRISIPALTSLKSPFTGQYSAAGGAGSSPGGAGTIFMKAGASQMLVVNNGGLAGTNTPLSSALAIPSSPFELDILGGASVVPLTPLPLLSNLTVSAASTLTMPAAQSNLFIGIIGNASIAGDLDVDDLGYSLATGPGAGVAIGNEGSGAGYGGAGGASDSGAPGGGIYGSATAPTAFGSGGGNGANTINGGSSGGGALRLSVAGTLNVSGNISANGDSGLQDDSGGGSGGSVWISAGTLSGAGTISVSGGDGAFYGGGGGGGGRLAIYTPTNQFTGTTNVSGGTGAVPGQPGTVSLSSALDSLQILSQSPTGLVLNTVSSVNLTFSDMLNAGSVSTADFTLTTPDGPLAQSSLSVAVTSPYTVQLSFPTQNLEGTYTIQVAATISDAFGVSLTQSFTGTFTVSIPTISGTVAGTNGTGVAGVTMQASGGLIAATTDVNGNYSLGVPPGWTGTVTPSFGSNFFLPPSMSYTNITGSLTSQNYSMVQTISPTLTSSVSAGNFSLNWNGLSGLTYQVLWSTNLVTWQPLGSPITGTNGPMQITLPSGSNSAEFFELQAGD